MLPPENNTTDEMTVVCVENCTKSVFLLPTIEDRFIIQSGQGEGKKKVRLRIE